MENKSKIQTDLVVIRIYRDENEYRGKMSPFSLLNMWSFVYQHSYLGFPGGLEVKALPGMRKTRVRSLGREDPLEKEMPTNSITLAWKNPMERGAS